MGSCIFNILEAPGPVTGMGCLVKFIVNNSIYQLCIPNKYHMKFRQTLGGLKEVLSHTS